MFEIVVKHWVRGEKKPIVEQVATFRQDSDASDYVKWLASNVHRQGPIGDRVEVLMTEENGVVHWSSGKIKVR